MLLWGHQTQSMTDATPTYIVQVTHALNLVSEWVSGYLSIPFPGSVLSMRLNVAGDGLAISARTYTCREACHC